MFPFDENVTHGASSWQSQGHGLQTCFSGRQTTTNQISYNHKLGTAGLLRKKHNNNDDVTDLFIYFILKC